MKRFVPYILTTVMVMMSSCQCRNSTGPDGNSPLVGEDDPPIVIPPVTPPITPPITPPPVFHAPTEKGPYTFSTVPGPSAFPSYMVNISNVTYTIPSGSVSPPFPTIILEPGFFSMTTFLGNVQDRYASHGFLVIGVNNTSHFNLVTTTLEPYKSALLQTLRFIIEANADSASAIFGLVDTTAIGLTGHSMGGGGALLACNEVDHSLARHIRAAVAMNPFGRVSGPNIQVPILLVASEKDSVLNPFMWGVSSSPEDIYKSFLSLPETTPRAFANVAGMDHNAVVNWNPLLPTSGNAALFLPTMVSWFKVHLAGDARYRPYLDPAASEFQSIKGRFVAKGSVPSYAYNPGASGFSVGDPYILCSHPRL